MVKPLPGQKGFPGVAPDVEPLTPERAQFLRCRAARIEAGESLTRIWEKHGLSPNEFADMLLKLGLSIFITEIQLERKSREALRGAQTPEGL